MNDPTSLGSNDVNDLVGKMTKITKQFELPVELLE